MPGVLVKRRNDQVKSLFVASLPVFIEGVKVVVSVFLRTECVSHEGSYLSGHSFVRPQLAFSCRVLESQVALKIATLAHPGLSDPEAFCRSASGDPS